MRVTPYSLALRWNQTLAQAWVNRWVSLMRQPVMLALLPALCLLVFWIGGERALLVLALGLPLTILVITASQEAVPSDSDGSDSDPSLAALDQFLFQGDCRAGRSAACLILQIDGLKSIQDRHGRATQREVFARAMDRIRGKLRLGDHVARLEGEAIAVVLPPSRRLDLDELVQLSVRLQQSLTEPITLGGAQLYVTASIGFCIASAGVGPKGRALLDAAQIAADEAQRAGPGTIRAYSAEMARCHAARLALRHELEEALDRGEIRPYFQPQICSDTGEISGVEALARWHHPKRGCLPPGEFLPGIECNDLSDRLGEVMLFQSLSALAEWDREGLHVPTIAVNFSASELRNPHLIERIMWELDRFALRPERLTVEILENVIAQSENDAIVKVIAQLAKLGCGIDLDDFGTGHASISTIRRFAVRRLKIDRSFITHIDEDREQQRMTSAIISLAERLGLETLAEGVETAAENAMLLQLGCGHLQGFGLARPMPFDETSTWIGMHQRRPERIPRIGLRRR